MNKTKYTNILKIEIIQSVYVLSVVPSIDGNSGTVTLHNGYSFVVVPFSPGSANFSIQQKDKTYDVQATFSVASFGVANSHELNYSLYRKFVAKITLCDGNIIVIGDKYNPAKLDYSYDKSGSKNNISVTWQYHRHPLFTN